ncbi:hypothetical protein [Pontibacter chinhatensis]|uniref:HEAT repeat-containing protein n=1 Tax=Pontibacter chinhatensis TaxID=1436961 RepID=A0A1I2WJ71_9BACT|nr:hypothetical protein [Pontibacter chinhatensis]SFH01368.1 hypothetical protein SAMN05421739_10558 [Pontibacter chinhatensis]
MTREALLEALSSTLSKSNVQELAALAGDEKLPIPDLLDISFWKDAPTIAFRSAWVLEHAALSYPDCFLYYFPEFVQRLHEQQNSSCQRCFTKILMHLTSPKAPIACREALASIADQENIVEVIFDWLIKPETPVAVRVNCLDILLNFSYTFPWIKEELQAQTEFYLQDGSPAMLARGKKILRQVTKV